jgi:hypothetical protein
VVSIPNEIYEAARRSGVKSAEVAHWIQEKLAAAGVSSEASPADWPEDIWDAYKALREAHEPGACSGSAKGLFKGLGISGDHTK